MPYTSLMKANFKYLLFFTPLKHKQGQQVKSELCVPEFVCFLSHDAAARMMSYWLPMQ